MTLPDEQESLDFVTLGMFIIDEIHFKPPKPPEMDVLGGAGTWSVIGARLFRPPPSSRSISWIVHKGSGFPVKLENQIGTWQTSCNLLGTPERPTTRGWNSYGDDEARAFKYLTSKLRIDQTQLSDKQVLAKCFHLICTPIRCIDLVRGILERRAAQGRSDRPIFVWEPVPDSCKPEELPNALDALKHVDFLSPNHQELAAYFGRQGRTVNPEADEAALVRDCKFLLEKGFGPHDGTVVVRCGERGCLWMSTQDMEPRTLPAWHRPDAPEDDPESSSRVVDPTGAGNAFLGGFCAGLFDEHEDLKARILRAVSYGLVSASFAIEQVGMPVLSHVAGEELWNNDAVSRRLAALQKRL